MPSAIGSMPLKIEEIAPSWTSRALSIASQTGWPAFNPSVWWDGKEIITVIRTANYRVGSKGIPASMIQAPLELGPPDAADFRSVNYIGSLSGGLEWLRAPVPVTLPEGCGDPAWRERIEDCRLIIIEGMLFAVATIFNRSDCSCGMSLIRLGDDARISGVITLISPTKRRWEKNWMPLVRGRTLHLIYSCRPLIVVTLDFALNTMVTRQIEDGPEELAGWSGSSQGCEIDGSMLCILHRKVCHADRLRYSHRFVMFDGDLRISAMSAPFFFEHDGVEFCAGMTRVHDRLIVSYGVEDAAAMVGSLSVEEALNSLVRRRPD